MNTQHQICLPKTVDDLRTTLISAIAFYQGSPVKNLNKINEALATSLGFSNYDQLSSIIRHEEESNRNNNDTLQLGCFYKRCKSLTQAVAEFAADRDKTTKPSSPTSVSEGFRSYRR